MTEYAMAKTAAEIMAEDLNRTLASVRIVSTRLPRLATDQTASIVSVAAEESNLALLLPIVRHINSP
jgi:hypothetical protein